MVEIKNYLLRLTAAALVCSVATTLAGSGKLPGSLMKLLCGAVMAVALFSPLMNWSGFGELQLRYDFAEEAGIAAQEGKNAAFQAWADGIKAASEAYILDKADLYDAAVTVEVTVSPDQPPVPKAVHISGRISPYGKKMLMQEIADKLGIAEEDQVWTQ